MSAAILATSAAAIGQRQPLDPRRRRGPNWCNPVAGDRPRGQRSATSAAPARAATPAGLDDAVGPDEREQPRRRPAVAGRDTSFWSKRAAFSAAAEASATPTPQQPWLRSPICSLLLEWNLVEFFDCLEPETADHPSAAIAA
jgi:hypothetical protein